MNIRYVAMIAVIMIFPALPANGQTLTFSVKTELVRIDVLVIDAGKPVTDLLAENFEVRDNGMPQIIESVSYQEVPTSATLVLDMSGSVAGKLIDQLKGAGSKFFAGLRDRDIAALFTFSSRVRLESPFSLDLERVKLDLNRTKAQSFGRTSLVDASYAGLIYADSVPDRSLLVVFSDGLDTTSWLSEEDVLESAKQSDVVVYTISAGGLRDYNFFRDLAKSTGGSFFKIEDTRDLESVFLNILEEFRHRYLLTYSPRGVKRSGWHEIEVKVRKRSHDEVRARPGYVMEAAPDD